MGASSSKYKKNDETVQRSFSTRSRSPPLERRQITSTTWHVASKEPSTSRTSDLIQTRSKNRTSDSIQTQSTSGTSNLIQTPSTNRTSDSIQTQSTSRTSDSIQTPSTSRTSNSMQKTNTRRKSDSIKSPSKSGIHTIKDDRDTNTKSLSQSVGQKKEIHQPKKTAMVCAAIDFGTTFSGYAFSFIADPNKILVNNWNGAKTKTPTILLMTPAKHFYAFGDEAIDMYNVLVRGNKHKEWYYFEKFKMQLFVRDSPLDRDMDVEDILGKKMKAITIFSEAIKYIRKHMMDALYQVQTDKGIIMDTDIRWILTVPAIWDDKSKFFMREAAKEAGIPSDLLTLALEPEAASLFCKKELGNDINHEGCKYMVADLGGGTVDITCHEVQQDGTLKEIESPCGGDFGGTSVDNEYWKILVSIIGGKIMKQFKQEHLDEYWEMMNDLDIKKRTFNGQGIVHIMFPARLTEMHEKNVGMSFAATIAQLPKPDITFSHGKINIPAERMRALFNDAVIKIVSLVQELLEKIGSLDYIVLVGGFSESPYLQQKLRNEFDNILLLPKEPSLAVLQGAVIYGNESKAISSRTCRYTYGIARMEKFIPDKHPESKKVKMGNYVFCDDIFNKHIEIGTTVSLANAENAEYHEYFPTVHNMNVAVLEVYKSKKKNPQFIDEDGCDLVGFIKVENINPRNDLWCKLLVRLIFGGTELIVEVKDEENDIHIRGYVDFFG